MAIAPAVAQTGAKKGEWLTYGGDTGNTRYSALDQIDSSNFNKLQVAWRFKTDNLGPRPEYNLEATPLVVNGVLYSTAGTRRSVVALNAATGELLWVHGENEGARASASPRRLSGRGLAYWTDGKEERIVYVTIGYQLVELNAKTGAPVAFFGNNGIIDLKMDDDQEIDAMSPEIGLHATPLVAKDVIVVGAAHKGGGVPKSKTNVKGYVRGFDARTGKRLWTFHTIPKPGEPGLETWEKDSWSYTGNTGSWGQAAIDEDLGLAYLGIEEPTGDFYGGHRPGNNLFSDSLVALDIKTGKVKWYYQYVHHDIWDLDNPCPPILANVTVDGRAIKAVAQPTKQSFLYVLDRTNGKPVWPIEERPVPKGDVPGEWYSPTQPIPTKPPAYEIQGYSVDDLINFTPELRAEAVKIISRYRLGPVYTPPVVSKPGGPIATIRGGGSNWSGGSYDPETGILYVSSHPLPITIGLQPGNPTRTDMNYVQGRAGDDDGGGFIGGITVQGLPIVKPPYGRLTAIDLKKGEILWQIAHGDTPDDVRNNPALKGLNVPRTGRPTHAGQLVTKTLLIAGERGFNTEPNGQRGAMLRAYDKATGKDAGAVYMPAPQSGSPMTYMLNGKQYIVLAISGSGFPGELIAYRLPN
ncbi:MAG TPA: PQQ-binding-like beta-propeller repeat protein [Bryobacteraceae bacterium]